MKTVTAPEYFVEKTREETQWCASRVGKDLPKMAAMFFVFVFVFVFFVFVFFFATTLSFMSSLYEFQSFIPGIRRRSDYIIGLVTPVIETNPTRSGNRSGHSRLCDFKWPQIDIWPHNIGRASQADQHVWVLWPCYVTWTSYSIFWWKWTFDPSDPKWPQNDIWPHNIGRGSQDDEHV